jgi:hypothetical protein
MSYIFATNMIRNFTNVDVFTVCGTGKGIAKFK